MEKKDAIYTLKVAISVLREYQENHYRWEEDDERRYMVDEEIADVITDVQELLECIKEGSLK